MDTGLYYLYLSQFKQKIMQPLPKVSMPKASWVCRCLIYHRLSYLLVIPIERHLAHITWWSWRVWSIVMQSLLRKVLLHICYCQVFSAHYPEVSNVIGISLSGWTCFQGQAIMSLVEVVLGSQSWYLLSFNKYCTLHAQYYTMPPWARHKV